MKRDTSFCSMEEKVSQDVILLSMQIIIGISILSEIIINSSNDISWPIDLCFWLGDGQFMKVN